MSTSLPDGWQSLPDGWEEEVQTLVLRQVRKYGYVYVDENPIHVINICPLREPRKWMPFTEEVSYQHKTIDLNSEITHLWHVTYLHSPSGFGAQFLVSYTPWCEQELGYGYNVETWWPYPLVP